VDGGVSGGSLHRSLQSMDVQSFVAGVVNGEGERDHGGVLSGNLHGDDIVERTGGLRFGTLEKRYEGDDNAEHDDGDDQDPARGEAFFGRAEFLADVDGWAGRRGGWLWSGGRR